MSLRHPVSVLVVDDKPRNVTALQAALARLDCNLVTADSGHAALRCVLTQDFAEILLDLLTAHDDDGARVMDVYRLGAVDYRYKPFEPEVPRSR